MIISHKYKFIFLKTNKTAGTSIEIALSKFCGGDDIITTLRPEEEEMRKNLGYCGPQNYLIPKSRYRFKDWRQFLFKGRKQEFRNHNSAEKIIRYLGEDIWNSYFKFCVVRNPWDRMISLYYWCNKKEPRPGISEFLETDKSLRFQNFEINIYTINGKIAVDKICCYENLEEELEKVRIRCGLPEKIALPNAKGSTRKDHRDYREILNKEQAEKIRQLSMDELDLLGYEF